MLVEQIDDNTVQYSNSVSKKERKKIGQFFTPAPIAKFMASLVEFNQSTIRILDPGAGTGILSGAICQEITKNELIKRVHIDLFETDNNVIDLLIKNMELIKKTLEIKSKEFTYNIIQENFILFHTDVWNGLDKQEAEQYDVVISNPPYKKIGKSDKEAIAMKSIIYGQPNIYFLFMALSAKLLKKDGQMIFITPRSFTSGAYFRRFREYFLNTINLTNLHLFNSRVDVFDSDNVLQEAIILKGVKNIKERETVLISSSERLFTGNNTMREVPYETVVDMESENLFIKIPTTDKEIALLNTMKSWTNNLISLGFRLKTGPVVDFRATQLLREKEEESTVPLLWASHFSKNQIEFPLPHSKYLQYIVNTQESKSLLLPSKDFIIIKRFTSKEEKRRIQCALYFAENSSFEVVGIENHLNYVSKLKGNMTKEELYGLFALLNSSFMDTYYRILNGSTQVNATEVNAIPLPSLQDVRLIGRNLLETNCFSTEFCDSVIEKLFLDNDIKATAV